MKTKKNPRFIKSLIIFIFLSLIQHSIIAQITINSNTTTATVNASGDPVIVSGSGYLKNSDINIWLGDGISVIVQSSGDISVSESITKSGGGNCYLTLKANGSIWTTDNKTIGSSSGALSLVFWADADGGGAGSGTIDLQCDITTNGGGVWMGGGDGSASWTPYSGASALTVGDGSATGLVNKNGIDFYGEATIATGAGNVSINGEYSYGTVGGTGFSSFDNTKINTTTGNVEIIGINNNNKNVGVWTRTAITTSSGNISMTGSGYSNEWGGLNSDWGLMLYTSSGNITLDGTNNHPSGPSIRFGNHTNLGEVGMVGYNNSDIPSSTSDVIFRGDSFVLGTSSINTSGTFTIEPKSASFPSAFTWPSNLSLVSTVSGLTIGKSTNTANVTLGNALTIAGPITVYGGNISVNADMTTTYNSATGVLLKASGSIMQEAGADVITGGGSVIFWADTDADSDGMIYSNSMTITTNGGHLWMGGGAASGTSWNGLTVGNGYAVGNGTMSSGIGINASTITTSGGNMAMYGKGRAGGGAGFTGNTDGIRLEGVNSINSGTGTIYWKGIAQTGGNTSANGIELSTSGGSVIKSENTTADAIYMYGESANATALNAWGIYSWANTIEATGAGGGITLEGKGYKHNGVTIISGGSVLAASGPITLNGLGHGTGYYAVQIDGNVGSKAGSDVTSSSSQIVVDGDSFTGSGTISTTNSLAFNLSGSSTFSGIITEPSLELQGTGIFTVGSTGTLTCDALTVGSSATLSLNSGASLITNGSITNNGTISVSRTISEEVWHLISSPITHAVSGMFEGDYMQYWTESTATWTDITSLTDVMTPGQGYGLWATAGKSGAHTYTFSGTPNTGNVAISYTASGTGGEYNKANLLGNPYPSSISWDDVSYTGAVYIWNGSGYNSYQQDDHFNVPPMQGFFIVPATAGTFTFTNASRTHSGSGNFYKDQNIQESGIILMASNGSYSDKLRVRIDEHAELDFEQPVDAWKLKTNTPGISQLWSVCPDGDLSIDVRPFQQTIQLGFANDTPGFYTIGISEIADITTAILEDTKENIFHDLTKGDYEFAWNPSDDEGRFVLHLGVTGIEQLTQPEKVLVYASGQVIYLKPMQGNTSGIFTLTDMSGRRIVQKELHLTGPTSVSLVATSGIYLASFTSEGSTVVKKVIIN